MPAGVSATGTWRCKKCKNSGEFTSMGELRSHQWAKHREMFKKSLAHSRSIKKKARMKRLGHALLPEVRTPRALNGDMRVSELLAELHNQQKFMKDVVDLVGGILARHQAAHQ